MRQALMQQCKLTSLLLSLKTNKKKKLSLRQATWGNSRHKQGQICQVFGTTFQSFKVNQCPVASELCSRSSRACYFNFCCLCHHCKASYRCRFKAKFYILNETVLRQIHSFCLLKILSIFVVECRFSSSHR